MITFSIAMRNAMDKLKAVSDCIVPDGTSGGFIETRNLIEKLES